MDEQDLANSLFGASRIEETCLNSTTTLQGVAVADSADGYVKVKIAGESVPEDADDEEPNTVVNLPTTPSVKEGDTVTITAEGGTLKVMTVTGNIGSGDRVQQSAEDAKKVATNYIDIDENKGITVGNMTDETLGKNTYIDANGFYVRDGDTTLASFSDTSIKLAQNTTENGTASIYLCNEQAKIEKVEGEGLLISNLTSSSSNGTAISIKGGYERKDGDVVKQRAYSKANIDTTVTIDTVGGLKINSLEEEVSPEIVGGTTYTSNVDFLKTGATLTYTSYKNGTATEDENKCVVTITPNGMWVDDKQVSLEGHTHPKSEITDFSHSHTKSDITDFSHSHTKSDITDFSHTHTKSDITDFSHSHTKSDITDFAHTHTKSEITDFSHTHTKSEITDFAHTHTMSDLSGTLPISKGGTGSTTASNALSALGGAKVSHTHTKSQITDFDHDHSGDALTPATINTTSTIKQNGTAVSLSGHTHSASDITSGTLPVARGGTGATDATTARTNLGCAATSHNHSASQITSGTLAVARGGTGKTAGTFYGETQLYNDTTGTINAITLSSSSANFTYIEIFYRQGSSGGYGSVKVYTPNGKKAQLQQTYWASGTTTSQTNFETVTISGTSISRGTMGYFQTAGSSVSTGTTTRQFYITRVVGYK